MNQPTQRATELHRLAADDYAKGQAQRAAAQPAPPYTPFANDLAVPATPESSDLTVAARVGHLLLSDYGDSSRDGFSYPEAYGALREALRLVLRALDAEPLTDEERARRSVDRAFPVVAAFLAEERGEDQ